MSRASLKGDNVILTEIRSMANFQDVLRSIGDKLFVVDFFATWCGPCKQLAPKFRALIPKHLDVMFAMVDADKAEQVCEVYGVQGLPTVMIFKNRAKLIAILGDDIDVIEAKIQYYKAKG